MPKLKVYCSPIGFHDVYVAATSQKAALAAWGSDADLFARGVAEQVDDPTLTAEPLAHPGEVFKRLRGTKEQRAALRAPAKAEPKERPQSRRAMPSRARLEAAETALGELERRQAAERKKLQEKLDRARTSYERAVERWRS